MPNPVYPTQDGSDFPQNPGQATVQSALPPFNPDVQFSRSTG